MILNTKESYKAYLRNNLTGYNSLDSILEDIELINGAKKGAKFVK